jgi:hypothetical protein
LLEMQNTAFLKRTTRKILGRKNCHLIFTKLVFNLHQIKITEERVNLISKETAEATDISQACNIPHILKDLSVIFTYVCLNISDL